MNVPSLVLNRNRLGLFGAALLLLIAAASCSREPASLADTGSAPETASVISETEMLARVFPSIVRIEAIRLQPSDGRLTKAWVAGSGVIISDEGYVLTNCHVSEDADYYRLYLYDGETLEATSVGQDAMTDLAVLKLDLSQRDPEAAPLPVAKFGDSEALVPGDVVFALGSPGFLSQSSTRGVVANPSMVLPEQTAGQMMLRGENVGLLVRWILHDATIFGGNSGGPLVNAAGEVIGINEIGVFSLSGAIPANLAREIADEIIATGSVTRGWSGLTVQERLESSGKGPGVVVSDVATPSPAANADLKPGDIIISVAGNPIQGEKEVAVTSFYHLETSQRPGEDVAVEYLRNGEEPRIAQVKLERREAARADDVELRAWGAVVRNVTRELARDARLPDTSGVWFENIRAGGPAGQSEPGLNRQDILIAVDGDPIANVAALKAVTERLIPDDESTGTRTVLATVRRNGSVLNSVVDLWVSRPKSKTPQALKAWMGIASQPLTLKLGNQLNISSNGGVRITRVYEGTKAAEAGLQVGDVLTAIDGMAIEARREEDADFLDRMIRQYRVGTEVALSVWRDGRQVSIPVSLELQPPPVAEQAEWEDLTLEYEVRDLAFDDRVRLQLPLETTGVLVSNVIRAGWANLAGLRADDLILEVNDTPVSTVAELQERRNAIVDSEDEEWLLLLIRRGGETEFVEISLKQPLQS